MKVHFSKTCFTPQQHVTLLKDRGLSISDETKAVSYLTNIGYFRLSAYFYPLLEFPKEQHRYKPDATFKKVMDMYRFDRKLRLLLFNEIEKIEVAIRSCITNYASLNFGNLFWLTDKSFFSKNPPDSSAFSDSHHEKADLWKTIDPPESSTGSVRPTATRAPRPR